MILREHTYEMTAELGRIMALDTGDARIGIALSDPLGIIASPAGHISAIPPEAAMRELMQIIREKEVKAVVIGLPRLIGGEEGEQARKARAFAETFRGILPTEIPIYFEDERFTTAMAGQVTQKKRRANRRKGEKDAIAAAHILRTFLDRPVPSRQEYVPVQKEKTDI